MSIEKDDRSIIRVKPPSSERDESGETSGPSPAERASELVRMAYGHSEAPSRLRLAADALALDADCVEALVLLAEEDDGDDDRRIGRYRRAIEAAHRKLGRETFREQSGFFWGVLEARPMLRAMFGLAGLLWKTGNEEEALDYYRRLLVLDTGDHLGARYHLMYALIEKGLDSSARGLGDVFETETTVAWTYSRALVAFRLDGGSGVSAELLGKALDLHPGAARLLLSGKDLDADSPSMFGLSEEQREAVAYAARCRTHWVRTEGALEWLARAAGR